MRRLGESLGPRQGCVGEISPDGLVDYRVFQYLVDSIGTPRDPERAPPVAFLVRDRRALRDLRFLWERAWGVRGETSPALLVLVRSRADEERDVSLVVETRLHGWAREAIRALLKTPVVTADVLRGFLRDADLESHDWSYRLRALEREGLIQRVPGGRTPELRTWHEEATGVPLGRRPLQVYRSWPHDLIDRLA